MPFPPTVPSTTLTPLTSAAGATSQSAWANAMQAGLTATVDFATGLDVRVDDRWVSAADYGAVGDGVTNDAAALISAVSASVSAGVELYLPPGDYYTGSTPITTPTTSAGKLRIRGAGKGVTRITRLEGVGGAAANVFNVLLTGASVAEFRDFSIIGPTGLGFDNNSIGINWITGGLNTHRLIVERVEVTGTLDHCIMNSVGGRVEIIDCDLAATDVCVAMFESAGTTDGASFLARGGVWGTPDGDLTTGGSVGLYIHPHIPHNVQGVEFNKLGRYAIYQNGSPSAARRPAVISGCQFNLCEIAQTKTNGRTVFSGCVARGSSSGQGSSFSGEVVLDGCLIERHLLSAGPVTPMNVAMNGGVYIDTQIVAAGSNQRWKVNGATFVVTDGATITGAVAAFTGSMFRCSNSHTELENVTIVDESTTRVWSNGINISGTLATVRISRLHTRGIRSTGSHILIDNATAVTIDDCDFSPGTNTSCITIDGASVLVDTIDGRNNMFRGTGIMNGSSTVQQRLVRRTGVNPTAIASASSLDTITTPWLSYDTHVITGSTTINNLTNPKWFVGAVRLVVAAGATWAIGSAGNIVAAGGARTADTVVTLLWEPIRAKWLEV